MQKAVRSFCCLSAFTYKAFFFTSFNVQVLAAFGQFIWSGHFNYFAVCCFNIENDTLHFIVLTAPVSLKQCFAKNCMLYALLEKSLS